jgi:GT2 family glycosyltransferase
MAMYHHSSKSVCIVVLNWNQPAMTVDCVRAVLVQSGVDHTVLVIDNGSTLENRTELRRLLPEKCIIIQNECNLGFASGMNVGIHYAIKCGFEYVWLLNNDAFPEPGCLEALIDRMNRDQTLAAVTPRLLHEDRSPHTIGATLDWNDGVQTLLGLGDIPYPTTVGTIIIGTALLLRCSVLQSVGGFDGRFFAYREEDDLCTRILRSGNWNLADVPGARCVHLLAKTSGGVTSQFSQHLMTRNGLHLIRKHLPLRWLVPAYLRAVACGIEKAVKCERYEPKMAAGIVGGVFAALTFRYGKPKRLTAPPWFQAIVLHRHWGICRWLRALANRITPKRAWPELG